MYNIEQLVKNELNDLFFSYSYSEISVSDKSKEQIISSIVNNIQRTTGKVVSDDVFTEINSVLDKQISNLCCSKF